MDEAPNSSSSNRLVLIIVLLPVLYLLSVGPAIRYQRSLLWAQPFLEKFYSPLLWLHENTLLRAPLDAYARLWDR